MLTPEQLQNLPTELTDLYSQLTEFILRDIARRIAKGAKITDTAEYQLYRARSLGMSEEEIAAKIAEINGTSADVIDKLIRDAAAQSDEFDRRMLGADDGAAVPLEDNKQLQKLMAAQIKETAGDCENLTGTMGFADHDFLGRVYYLSMTDMYRRELDSAHMKVVTGTTDYMTAIRQACNKLAASGVRTIDYESGRSDRVEVAVRRALLTSVGHITHRISEENGKEFGADGWEMSAHSGARPSHAVYQGRQYTQAEYEKKIKPLLSEPNCRHDVFPIILGVSEPTYTEEQLRNIDPKPFTYEGRKYTAYEASQQMRKMERAMRKQKDRCIVADAAGDKESFATASVRLNRQKYIYEDFCKAADSYTQYERTYVAGYDRRLAGKTGAVTRKQREFEKAQMRLTDGENGGIIKPRQLAQEKEFSFYDYDIVEDLPSVDRLRKFAAEKMGITHITGIEKLKNGNQAQQILTKVEELSKEYNKRFTRITIIDFGNKKVAAETLGCELRLNVEFMNRPSALEDVLKDWEGRNYIPKGCSNLQYLGAHEFGHLLTADLIDEPRSKIKTEINRALDKKMAYPSLNAKLKGYHEIAADIFAAVILDDKQQAFKKKLIQIITKE